MAVVIRPFQIGDEDALRELFFQSIHQSCQADYSSAQLAAWAPKDYDTALWKQRIGKINPFIATLDKHIAGYADLQLDGYIDHFFCHPQFRGRGVAKALMAAILSKAQQLSYPRLYSQVSITAKPFFEYSGFQAVREQQVEVRGATLSNYLMEHWL